MSDLSRRWQPLASLLLILVLLTVWVGCGLIDSGTATQSSSPLTVSPISLGDCKDLDSLRALDSLYGVQLCLEYSHDGDQTLSFTHVNGNWTCCPDSLKIYVDLEGNVITIIERVVIPNPESNICYCICVSDLNYTITGIRPGDYTIRMMPGFGDTIPLIQFSADFRATPADVVCRYRPD